MMIPPEARAVGDPRETTEWKLRYAFAWGSSSGIPTATVVLAGPNDKLRDGAAIGVGPVHAIGQVINRVTGREPKVITYVVENVTQGLESPARVTFGLSLEGRIAAGTAENPDILVASAQAYVAALNNLLAAAASESPARTAS